MVLFTVPVLLSQLFLAAAHPVLEPVNLKSTRSLSTAELISPNTTAYIQGLQSLYAIPGVAIAVVTAPTFGSNNGSWASQLLSFGNATAGGKAVDEHTIFALGSNSKLFTALAIELLIANQTVLPSGNGTLSFATKIADILPEWQLQDSYASTHVDVTDLLTMRSGMPRHDLSYAADATMSEVVAMMRNLRPSTEIRQAFQYNNFHYMTLALVVERVSGTPFANFVQTHILSPIGMNETYYNSTTVLGTGNAADGFQNTGVNLTHCYEAYVSSQGTIDPTCFGNPKSLGWFADSDVSVLGGAGAVASTAADMALWLRELLQPAVLPAGIVQDVSLGRESMGLGPGFQVMGEQTYGYGQLSYSYRGNAVVYHTGSVPGFASEIMRLPDAGVAVAVLTNGASSITDYICWHIVDQLLGLEPIDWSQEVLAASLPSFGIPAYPSPPAVNVTPPSVPFDSIAGSYTDAGYGTVNLTLMNATAMATDPVYTPLFVGPDLPINLTGPVWVADINKFFGSKLVFTHFDGDFFNATAMYVRGNVSTVLGPAPVVVTGDGIGAWGIWGQGSTVPTKPVVIEGVEEACEVWFKKD